MKLPPVTDSTPAPSRRDLLQKAGAAAAVTALSEMSIPFVHAGQDSNVRLALVGCGGRGGGAAADALNSKGGPVRLVAMADVFEDRLNGAYNSLQRSHAKLIDVPKERRYIGFDGYRKAMNDLRKGDVVILATPPAFRWPHYAYAIEKDLNVFMEKPVTVDAPSTVRMLKLNEAAEKKGLKVGVGLMCRHCVARGELHDRIKKGEIGDITLLRAYRVAGPTGSAFVPPKPQGGDSELLWQIRNFHGFLWASGGAFSDFLIHNIDECCWMKDAWPVEAKGYGGRHYRGNNVDQNFDVYSVEYTFADGTKLMLEGRCMPNCDQEFASYAHGTRGSAVISTSGHFPARARIYKTQRIGNKADLTWAFPANKEPSPYQLEWDDLMAAIRNNRPYNEVKRGCEASLVTAMGRMACHTGRKITYQQMTKVEQEFAPEVDKLTLESASPLRADKDGKYPVPEPGRKVTREY